jgi:hypothetical protein
MMPLRGLSNDRGRIPEKLREVARNEAKNLNQVVMEALERGLGLADGPVEHHDLDDLAGSWIDDPEFDAAIAEMNRVDAELWK